MRTGLFIVFLWWSRYCNIGKFDGYKAGDLIEVRVDTDEGSV